MTAAHPPRGAAGRAEEPREPAARPPVDPLADDELAEEIELYTDVVLAASESEGPLRAGELDRLLGVEGRSGTS
ncbi:hypothetical protein NUM3379_40530 [Kineococcus sp. NUM-3379]